MSKLTHTDDSGQARMVDIGVKPVTDRLAVAIGRVSMGQKTLDLVRANGLKKGDVLSIARLAGIMGAKRTADLIPLCHPISLTAIAVELRLTDDPPAIDITATCKTTGQTGVEMEALTAVSVAALTIYDMCKAVDRTMRIDGIRLLEKSGGQSGDFRVP